MLSKSEASWIAQAATDALQQLEHAPIGMMNAVCEQIMSQTWMLIITPRNEAQTELKQATLDLLTAQKENNSENVRSILVRIREVAMTEEKRLSQ